jgi:hypothetical protein
MLSKDNAEPRNANPEGAKADPASSVPPMNPGSPIEVASTGDGTINDPAPKDIKPPGFGEDSDLYRLV